MAVLCHDNNYNFKGMTEIEKIEQCCIYIQQQCEYYHLISKLFILAYRRNFKLIVENPYTQPHFLTLYFPIKPKVIDMDRTQLGDYFIKPTQYWFINCEPLNNNVGQKQFVFGYDTPKPRNTISNRHYEDNSLKNKELSSALKRSLISPDYAYNFIKKYIINKEETE